MRARPVHLINCLSSVGGAERLVLDLCEQSPYKPVPVITWLKPDNSLLRNDTSGAVSLISLRPFSRGQFERARQVLRNAEVVHVHLFPSLYLAPFIRQPMIFTEHNTWNRRREHGFLRVPERWLYRRFAKVVAISDATGAALSDWLGEPPNCLEIIPNGIRLDRFARRERTCPSGPRIRIGMAARFAPEKDHATLVRAMANLPGTYTLTLAAEGPLRPKARELSRRLGLENRVDFIGNVDDMPAFFDSIDVYVHSSNKDGFSLACVEAMASGVPTVASDIPGLSETIGSPEYLFEHGNPRDAAAKLRVMCESRALYERASRYAVKRAAQFDICETARRYQAAYDAVAESAK